MTSIRSETDSENGEAGGLAILAWFHGGELIARVTRTPDVAITAPSTTVVTTAERLHQVIDVWLSEIKR